MLSLEPLGTVLALDSDFLSRSFIQRVLRRAGYEVLVASTPTDAKLAARSTGRDSIVCVITDLSLPQAGGTDFLEWVGQEDAAVACIAISASSDKALVEQSLRIGACNFLDKPLDRFSLEQAVFDAVKLTSRKRRTAEIERDVKQVGAVQRSLIGSSICRDASAVSLCFHPKREAGGDFFTHLQLSPSRSVAMLTDVSGHELKSAFVSAYFQGMVRAMLENGTDLDTIFERANTFLLNETAPVDDSVPVSICVCSICVDLQSGDIELFNSGTPGAVFVTCAGECRSARNNGSYPLGWFPEKHVDFQTFPPVSGQIVMWTDGVEDLAERIGVTPCSVAYALTMANQNGLDVPWLSKASDDVLVASWRVHMPGTPESELAWYYPIVNLRYGHHDVDKIDNIQLFVMNSLLIALPGIGTDALHDILLCMREALINALQHGCAAGGEARLQVSVAPERQTLVLIVEDDGPGHDFDCEEHQATATTHLTARHRGLILMHALSTRFKAERRGAKLTMEFVCKEL